MWMRLHPAVPRHWLFAIAGVVWTAAGVLLCVRAFVWIAPFGLKTDAVFEVTSLLLGIVGYFYVFSKVVKKNISRIHTLPDRVCAFAFTAWRGYAMIVLMVSLGLVLRNSSIPKYYLSVPYTAMGGMLLIGSQKFFAKFVELKLNRSLSNTNH